MDLSAERCEACRSDSPLVSGAEQHELSAVLPDWEIVEVNAVPRLRRTFRLKDWMSAVRFANQVADAAEAEDHHPTILIAWGKVTVTWWTHAIKGLHRNVFVMAAKSDHIFDSHQ